MRRLACLLLLAAGCTINVCPIQIGGDKRPAGTGTKGQQPTSSPASQPSHDPGALLWHYIPKG